MKKAIDTFDEVNESIDQIINSAPKYLMHFVKRSTEITHQIRVIMDKKGIRPTDLAKLLGKSDSEISKLLSGTHNFTLKTLSQIETVLDTNVIDTNVGLKLQLRNYLYSSKSNDVFLHGSNSIEELGSLARYDEDFYGKGNVYEMFAPVNDKSIKLLGS